MYSQKEINELLEQTSLFVQNSEDKHYIALNIAQLRNVLKFHEYNY